MRYSDTTMTTTDWDEFTRPEITDYGPATENSDELEFGFDENRNWQRRQKVLDELACQPADTNRQSKSKLHAMFERFLYQK